MRWYLALLLVAAVCPAADRPVDPEARCVETLPDGRTRTWVPAGWTVVRSNEVQIDERWVPGHWEESAPPPAPVTRTVVVREEEPRRRRERVCVPVVAPVPLVVWPGCHRSRVTWSVVVGHHPACWWWY